LIAVLIYIYFVCSLALVINIAEILLTWNSNQSIDLDLIYIYFVCTLVPQLYLWRGQGYKQNIYRSDLGWLIDCCFTSAVFQLYLWRGQGYKQNIYLLTWNSNQSIDLDLIYIYFVCSLALVINIAAILLTWNSNQSIVQLNLWRGQAYKQNIYRSDLGRLIDCCFTSAVFQLYLWRGQGYKQNIYRSDLGWLIFVALPSS
jgi:hypothetical protein